MSAVPHDNHKECMREAVHVMRTHWTRIFPHQSVHGNHVPHDGGDPLIYIRAWIAILEIKSLELNAIAEDMAIDMQNGSDVDLSQKAIIDARAQEYVARARGVARATLNDLQPGANLHDSILDTFIHPTPMNPFVEVLQIQQGIQSLGVDLLRILNRCEHPQLEG